MPIIGAFAAALALFAANGDRGELHLRGSRALAATPRIAAPPQQSISMGAYVAGLVEAMSPPAARTDRPHYDGMSLRELRSGDLSHQTTFPLLAGRF